MTGLTSQVKCFQKWADAYPPDCRYGEWECDYPDWKSLYEAVLEFVADHPFGEWSTEQLEAVFYALARDNECQYLAEQICERHHETLIELAAASISLGEPDAKWQLAEELGQLQSSRGRTEKILLDFSRDTDEYVRRRALMSLARIESGSVEKLALATWHQPHKNQQWSRMAVLWSLHRVGSSHLEPLLAEAELDSRPHLSAYARRVRQGQVEP